MTATAAPRAPTLDAVRAGAGVSWSCRARWALAGVVVLACGACGGGGASASSAADQAFLSAVHLAAPDVATYRSDVQLTRLGHAACDGFRSGASFQQLADRLVLLEGSNPVPTADLGAVIDAATDAYCPQFRSLTA
jgi:hypothetical protein